MMYSYFAQSHQTNVTSHFLIYSYPEGSDAATVLTPSVQVLYIDRKTKRKCLTVLRTERMDSAIELIVSHPKVTTPERSRR